MYSQVIIVVCIYGVNVCRNTDLCLLCTTVNASVHPACLLSDSTEWILTKTGIEDSTVNVTGRI
jgi:hypothetical protein